MSGLNIAPTSSQPPTSSDSHYVAAAIGLAFPASLAVVGNALMIAAFMCNKPLRTRPTNYLLVNLAVANILVCLNAIPLRILHLLGSAVISCKATACFTITDCSGAILTLAATSVDRYIGVTRPFTYNSIVTPTRVILSIGAIWLISILVGFLPYMGWGALSHVATADLCMFAQTLTPEFVIFVSTTTVFLPLTVMVFCYAKIYVEVQRHVKQIRIVRVHDHSAGTGSSAALAEESKAAKTIARVLGAYMLCQAPISFVEFIGIYCTCVPPSFAAFAVILAYSNAFFSPLVCARVHSEFRTTLHWLVFSKMCKSRCGQSQAY